MADAVEVLARAACSARPGMPAVPAHTRLRAFVIVLIVAAPIAVAIRLLRQARRTPSQDEPLIPEPAVL